MHCENGALFLELREEPCVPHIGLTELLEQSVDVMIRHGGRGEAEPLPGAGDGDDAIVVRQFAAHRQAEAELHTACLRGWAGPPQGEYRPAAARGQIARR